jgi:hypothetical protein
MTMVCNGALQRHILRRQCRTFSRKPSAQLWFRFYHDARKSRNHSETVPDLFYVHAVHHSINMQIPTVTTAISTQQIIEQGGEPTQVYLL